MNIYFSKGSAIMPNQFVTAKLIDETDSGFYLLGKNDKTATFIPRGDVAMVQYSDSPPQTFLTKTK